MKKSFAQSGTEIREFQETLSCTQAKLFVFWGSSTIITFNRVFTRKRMQTAKAVRGKKWSTHRLVSSGSRKSVKSSLSCAAALQERELQDFRLPLQLIYINYRYSKRHSTLAFKAFYRGSVFINVVGCKRAAHNRSFKCQAFANGIVIDSNRSIIDAGNLHTWFMRLPWVTWDLSKSAEWIGSNNNTPDGNLDKWK